MREDEFVSAIGNSTALPTDRARTAARATLTVLGERVAGGETRDLAAQLPGSLADALPDSGAGQRFGVSEFYRRVARVEGAGCTPQQARQHARATATALAGSVTGGELSHLRAQLPAEYDDLFSTGPVHHH